jgi:hypothetical protein
MASNEVPIGLRINGAEMFIYSNPDPAVAFF